MPNVGDELHHFGWNRCSSACHGPDRSHLIVPGFRSSRDPRRRRRRRPAPAADREGDRAGGARREDRATRGRTRCTACPATTSSSRCSATPTATAPAASRCSTRRRSRSRAAGRTAARRRRSTTTSGTSRARTCSSRPSSASRTPTSRASTSTTSPPGRYGQRLHFWNLAERRLEQTVDLGENGLSRSRCAGSTTPTPTRASSAPPSRARCGTSTATTAAGRADQVIAVESVELEGWPFPVPGLITDLVLSMDDRFLYFSELAARRPAPVRRLRSRQPEAHRPALARRRCSASRATPAAS